MTVSCITSRAPRREIVNCITSRATGRDIKLENTQTLWERRWGGPYHHAGHFRLNHKETSEAQTNTPFDLVLQNPIFGLYGKQQHKQELGIQGFAR